MGFLIEGDHRSHRNLDAPGMPIVNSLRDINHFKEIVMTKNFIPLLDFELTYFNGGMFAPFINSENSVPAARPAAAPSARTWP
jgi:hypothetical protein